MTAPAGAAKTTPMPIVTTVTAGAIGRDIIGVFTLMATTTAQVCMGAREG